MSHLLAKEEVASPCEHKITVWASKKI